MKFRYIGAYASTDQTCEAFGVIFTPGAEVEVPPQWQSKARGNRFFEPVIDDAIIVEDEAEVQPEPEVAEATEDASDDDADGQEVSGMSKAELIAIAEGAGITIDRRWGPQRIADAIKAGRSAQ